MRLFRNRLRKPRYNIYFYHDLEVRYEINGDRPWIMLGYLLSSFACKDLRPSWQIHMFRPDKKSLKLEKSIFYGDSTPYKALNTFIEEGEHDYDPEDYLVEIIVDHKSGEQVEIITMDDSQNGYLTRLKALKNGMDHYNEFLMQKEKEFTLERVVEDIFQ